MNVNDKINKLRHLLEKANLDAYIIPSSDPHQSEYPAPHWESRAWLSGFTGSAGTLIVTQKHAGIWTDSRYFLQAEKQLATSDVVLHKQKIPHAPEHVSWLADHLPTNAKVGCDGMVFSTSQIRMLSKAFYEKEIELLTDYDLIPDVWSNRPTIPEDPIFELDVQYAGQSRLEKLDHIRTQMATAGANYHLISTLDDIAWTFNLRGKDVDCNPVFISYAVVGEKMTYLFIKETKVPQDLATRLKEDGIVIKSYESLIPFLKNIDKQKKILIDRATTSIQVFKAIDAEILLEGANIPRKLKAIKNDVEVGHIKNAMLKDGVALTRLYRWIDAQLDKDEKITEVDIAQKLIALRRAQGAYHDESFSAIVGYKGNGAIVHYRPEPGKCAILKKEGILLLDSGGQYMDGTTDITRTTALGTPTEEQIRNFTLVLKGHIALATLHFPFGTKGVQMDILARQALWKDHLNYGHGTGHGVGFFLNVHEPPQGIATSITTPRGSTIFEPGMFTSNEPGFYKEGEYGIRIENLILAVEAGKTAYGRFLKFDTLTLFPIDLSLVAPSLLNQEEIEWINNYHQEVFEKLGPLLEPAEVDWLKHQCRNI